MNETPRSVYVLGAENGLVMGPLLAAAVMLTGGAAFNALLALPMLAVILAVPVVAYIMLRRAFAAQPTSSTFPALWLQGICMFFFGGLIMAVVAFVSMRWLWPGYIHDMVSMAIAAYEGIDNPEARQIAATLRHMAETGALPSAAAITFNLVYATVFSGSLLSMLLAAVIRHTGRRQRPPEYPR